MNDAVLVAAIATAPPTLVAITGLIVAVKSNNQLKGNGRGTHTQMLEVLDDKVDGLNRTMQEHAKEDRRKFDQVFQSLDLFAEELKSVVRTGRNHKQ